MNLGVGDFVRGTHTSSDGSVLVVTTAHNAVQVWDTQTARRIDCPLTRKDGVVACLLSADNLLVVTLTTTRQVQVHDLATGQTVVHNHQADLLACAVTDDSRCWLAVANGLGTVCLYTKRMSSCMWSAGLSYANSSPIASCRCVKHAVAALTSGGRLSVLDMYSGRERFVMDDVYRYALTDDHKLYRVGFTRYAGEHLIGVYDMSRTATPTLQGKLAEARWRVNGCILTQALRILYGQRVVIHGTSTYELDLTAAKVSLSDCIVRGNLLIGSTACGKAYIWRISAGAVLEAYDTCDLRMGWQRGVARTPSNAWMFGRDMFPVWASTLVRTGASKSAIPQFRAAHMGGPVCAVGLVIATSSRITVHRATMLSNQLLLLILAARRRAVPLPPPECFTVLYLRRMPRYTPYS